MQSVHGITINSAGDYGTADASQREIDSLKSIIDRLPSIDRGHKTWLDQIPSTATLATLVPGQMGKVWSVSWVSNVHGAWTDCMRVTTFKCSVAGITFNYDVNITNTLDGSGNHDIIAVGNDLKVQNTDSPHAGFVDFKYGFYYFNY